MTFYGKKVYTVLFMNIGRKVVDYKTYSVLLFIYTYAGVYKDRQENITTYAKDISVNDII